MKNVLVMDAGGIRGYMTLHMIAYIEKISGYRCNEIFDLISGTSFGGLATALLSSGYSAEQIIHAIDEHGPKIFDKKFYRNGLILSKYSDRYLNEVLEQYFKNDRVHSTICNILIPVYNTSDKKTELIKNYNSRSNWLIRDAVRATVAAPTYFDHIKIDEKNYSDGGLASPNPADYAKCEMQMLYPGEKINMLSLGTGMIDKPIKHGLGGALFWVKQAPATLLKESVKKTHDVVSMEMKQEGNLYKRLDIAISRSSGEMDDASAKNMNNMRLDARNSVKKNSAELRDFVYKIL